MGDRGFRPPRRQLVSDRVRIRFAQMPSLARPPCNPSARTRARKPRMSPRIARRRGRALQDGKTLPNMPALESIDQSTKLDSLPSSPRKKPEKIHLLSQLERMIVFQHVRRLGPGKVSFARASAAWSCWTSTSVSPSMSTHLYIYTVSFRDVVVSLFQVTFIVFR